MKVTYTFNLPEDNDELDIFQRAIENDTSLYEIRQYIRSKLKHCDVTLESEQILLDVRNLLPEVSI